MKRYGSFGKNVAALLLLIALISLLLPGCQINAGGQVTKLSGLDIVSTGARMGVTYASNGNIDDSFVIKDNFTWGNMKSSFSYVQKLGQVKESAAVIAVCMLPVLLCILSMLMTWAAVGKKTMVVPTFLLILTVVEQLIIVLGFNTIQNMIVGYASDVSGVAVGKGPLSLLIGVYLFTILCVAALIIIMLLWLTHGFDRPERKRRYSDGDSDDSDDDDRRRSGRRRKRRRSKRSRRDKKKQKDKDSKEDRKKDDDNNDQKENTDNLTGRIQGNSGMYLGMDIDLSSGDKWTLGTTKEALDGIKGGHVRDISKITDANCTIKYNSGKNVYTISSHSDQDIIIRNKKSGQRAKLIKGQTRTIDSDSVVFVGRDGSSIRFR